MFIADRAVIISVVVKTVVTVNLVTEISTWHPHNQVGQSKPCGQYNNFFLSRTLTKPELGLRSHFQLLSMALAVPTRSFIGIVLIRIYSYFNCWTTLLFVLESSPFWEWPGHLKLRRKTLLPVNTASQEWDLHSPSCHFLSQAAYRVNVLWRFRSMNPFGNLLQIISLGTEKTHCLVFLLHTPVPVVSQPRPVRPPQF